MYLFISTKKRSYVCAHIIVVLIGLQRQRLALLSSIILHYKGLYFVKRIFINEFMQMHFDKIGIGQNGFRPFFPATINPSRRADSCVQQNTASCVLRHSKLKFVPQNKTCPCRGPKKTSEVGFLCELNMD